MLTRILLFLASAAFVSAGSAIFIHPDGTGLGHWNAARLLTVGPDGQSNWDKLDVLAAYRPHQANWLSTSSHAGATVHAYGKKVHWDSFGLDREEPITAVSGFNGSILMEAQKKELRTGLVNSGHIAEPGTAVFAASSKTRKDKTGIAAKVIESGTDVILCGGEVLLLPEGETGFFGVEGERSDGRNLIEEAREKGYVVVRTRGELLALPADTEKVLGIFAAGHTFNDQTEEKLAEKSLPLYEPDAPTFAEMTAAALRILSSDPGKDFLLVAEEEGSDNFSNENNAAGMLEATIRADEAIGVALAFLEDNPDRPTLLLVGADSDAGHPTVLPPRGSEPGTPLPERDLNGAPIDGRHGSGGEPFLSEPDALGNRHPFGIAWPTAWDVPGSVVAKAHGAGAEDIPSTLDNTDIYPILYRALFGRYPGQN